MGCQYLEELYELWALGALAGPAAQELGEHLERGCEHCRARVREATEMVYILGLATRPARPPARVKTELLREIAKTTSSHR